jgi:diacylglycerol kinase family enzyme
VVFDTRNLGDAASLAWKAVFADWRKDTSVTSVRADKIEVSAGGRIPALLDGEKVTLPPKAEIRYQKVSFTAVVPEHDDNRAD